MSEPGAMRSRGSASLALRVLLVVGFVVAAGATVLVVLAKDVQMLRLAAVLALWAALIAAFAVTRSRRDAKAAAMREKEAHLAYQVELHREVSARHEYEAELAAQMAEAQSQQIAELREQLDRLTEVLTALADGEVFVSRMTLSAESARFRAGQSLPAAGAPAAVAGDQARAIGWVEQAEQSAPGASDGSADTAAPVSVPDEARPNEARPEEAVPADASEPASVEEAEAPEPAAAEVPDVPDRAEAEAEPSTRAPRATQPDKTPRSVFDGFLSAAPQPESDAAPAPPVPATTAESRVAPTPAEAEAVPVPTGRRSRHAVEDDDPDAEVPWWRRVVDDAVRARESEARAEASARDSSGEDESASPSFGTQPQPLPTPDPTPEPFNPEPLPEPTPAPMPVPQPDPVYPPSPDPVPLYPKDIGRDAPEAPSYASPSPTEAAEMSPEDLLAAYGLTAVPRRRRRN